MNLLAADEANKIVHMGWLHRHTPGMRVDEDEQLIVIDSGLPTDTFNLVCRTRLAPETLRERVDRVVAHFQRVARPFSWWVGPLDTPEDLGRALVDAGFEEAGAEPGMAADLDALAEFDLEPHGLRIERARTPEQIREFGVKLSALWTPPDEEVVRFYEAATPALLRDDCPIWLYVGYLDGEMVATSQLAVGGGVVGLYNISTDEAHRRKGIGSAMTVKPLVDAKAAGFATAILQASDDGKGVYERIGFTVTSRFAEYKL